MDRPDKVGIHAKKNLHRIHTKKIPWTMELAITQTFSGLDNQDFAWTIQEMGIQILNRMQICKKKYRKHKKYKKLNSKFGRCYRSCSVSFSMTIVQICYHVISEACSLKNALPPPAHADLLYSSSIAWPLSIKIYFSSISSKIFKIFT